MGGWEVARRLAGGVGRGWARARSEGPFRVRDGCMSCGGPVADWRYWGAQDTVLLGLDPTAPDWEGCRACHEAGTGMGAWFRGLRHEPITRDAAGRRCDGSDRVRGLAAWFGGRS